MDIEIFVSRYPTLWHLADSASWLSIERHGLLSTSAILRQWDVPSDEAERLLSSRRPTSVTLEHPTHGQAVLRDQRPLSADRLGPALTGGMTVNDWLRLLNTFVFLFPTEAGLRALYETYRQSPAVVLQVSTGSLVQQHRAKMRLAGINTGYTMRRPALRGADTFLPIDQYDHSKRKAKEVVVQDGIPDLGNHLIKAERWLPDGTVVPLLLA